MAHTLAGLAALAVATVAAPTTISRSHLTLSVSTVSESLLPTFLFQEGALEGGGSGLHYGGGKGTSIPFVPSDQTREDIFIGANADLRSPQLPYLTQDRWGCERKSKDVATIVLENDFIKASVVPEWGGRVWQVVDKATGKDLVHNNPAHQPANIGARKAWSAGGIEFNYSPGIIGHSAFAESPVYTAKIDTAKGPVLRMWEFDRYNSTVWQVDLLLLNNTLFVHPKITNPTTADLRGYWWTCVAHHTTPGGRVVTPATAVAVTEPETGTRTTPWPFMAPNVLNSSFLGLNGDYQHDTSYLGNIMGVSDYFVRIPHGVSPYIAHAEEKGWSVIHGHTLNGTKFFTWGQNGPGRFLQDFLGGGEAARKNDREGDYTELQTGPAPTQMQTWGNPALTSREWTEWFQGWQAASAEIHNSDYARALAEVDKHLAGPQGLSQATIKEVNAFLEANADIPVDAANVLTKASPWGALEEMRQSALKQTRTTVGGKHTAASLAASPPDWADGCTIKPVVPVKGHLAPGVAFSMEASAPEITPWIELLQTGTFSTATLAQTIPLSYNTNDDWLQMLSEGAASHGNGTWLHSLHIGVALAERGDVALPSKHFRDSLRLNPLNPIAERSLALLQAAPADVQKGLLSAWNMSLSLRAQSLRSQSAPAMVDVVERVLADQAGEVAFFLQQEMDWEASAKWLATIPSGAMAAGVDSVLALSVRVALSQGDNGKALDTLGSECFPTYAGNRFELKDMWYQAQEQTAARDKGRPLTLLEARAVRLAHPSPDNIGCTYAKNFCSEYW